MSLEDLLRILRARWVTATITALATISGAVVYSLLQTPQYEASTRLFVSATAATNVDSANELLQGSRYSQDRVLSYTQLIMGETLAMRTIDRLNLDISASTLKARVTAKSKSNTVLIDVSVLDQSPVRARDIANALSDEFVVMARELETPSPGARPEARVVVEQRASISENPVVPKKTRNLALGIALGGMLGLGIAIVRDRLDNSVKTQQDLEGATGTGIVGYIPIDKRLSNAPTISFDNDNSPTAEAFRKLRTNLQFLAVDDPPRVIVVTSALPSEGKSTTSLNVALALAEAEHNVLVVDGDLRRPKLSKYLDALGVVGVSSVLSGAAPLAEVLQETRFPRLTFLAAGPTPPNPSELLGSLSAEKMFGELRAQFDYVIIDSAPLLAVTDGAILAARSDGALLVTRAGKTKRGQLVHAVELLNDVGANLLGAVLNLVPTRGAGAYAYTSYYYGSSYGNARPKESVSEASPENAHAEQSARETDRAPE